MNDQLKKMTNCYLRTYHTSTSLSVKIELQPERSRRLFRQLVIHIIYLTCAEFISKISSDNQLDS